MQFLHQGGGIKETIIAPATKSGILPGGRLIGVDSLKRAAADCAPMMDALRPGFESGAYPAPVIADRYGLAQAEAAYAAVARGTRGRVVLIMQPG